MTEPRKPKLRTVKTGLRRLVAVPAGESESTFAQTAPSGTSAPIDTDTPAIGASARTTGDAAETGLAMHSPERSSKKATAQIPTDEAVQAQAGAGAESPRALRERAAAARRRGIYLLPNLLTTGALFAGFFAMVAALNGRFGTAGLAIFAAIVLDTADGRVARMTRTESNFGAQYDSLSDLVAFGVAPALVAFLWGLSSLGQVGLVVAFTYIACTALRLARFNTNSDLASFVGLPSPSAAAVIACTVWVWEEYAVGSPSPFAASMLGLITTAIALLMVSNLTYFSPKQLGLKGRVPFVTLVLVVLAFAVLLADPPSILLALSSLYALSAPSQYVWRRLRRGGRPDA